MNHFFSYFGSSSPHVLQEKNYRLHSDLIRKVLLSVRQIYVVGLSSCYICIMVTLGFRLGHLWDTCTWSQRHYGSLPITPSQLILPMKKKITWLCPRIYQVVECQLNVCILRFYLLSQIVVWIEGDFYQGPTDYRRWLVVGCNPFRPSLSKTPLGYAHLPEDRQHGRWILLPLFSPPSNSTTKNTVDVLG